MNHRRQCVPFDDNKFWFWDGIYPYLAHCCKNCYGEPTLTQAQCLRHTEHIAVKKHTFTQYEEDLSSGSEAAKCIQTIFISKTTTKPCQCYPDRPCTPSIKVLRIKDRCARTPTCSKPARNCCDRCCEKKQKVTAVYQITQEPQKHFSSSSLLSELRETQSEEHNQTEKLQEIKANDTDVIMENTEINELTRNEKSPSIESRITIEDISARNASEAFNIISEDEKLLNVPQKKIEHTDVGNQYTFKASPSDTKTIGTSVEDISEAELPREKSKTKKDQSAVAHPVPKTASRNVRSRGSRDGSITSRSSGNGFSSSKDILGVPKGHPHKGVSFVEKIDPSYPRDKFPISKTPSEDAHISNVVSSKRDLDALPISTEPSAELIPSEQTPKMYSFPSTHASAPSLVSKQPSVALTSAEGARKKNSVSSNDASVSSSASKQPSVVINPSEGARKWKNVSSTHASVPLPASKQPSVVLAPSENARKWNNVSSNHASVSSSASKQRSIVASPSEDARKWNNVSSTQASDPLPSSKQPSAVLAPSADAGKWNSVSSTHASVPLPASTQPSIVITPSEAARKWNNVSSIHASIPLPVSKQPSAVLTPFEEALKINYASSTHGSVPLPVLKQPSNSVTSTNDAKQPSVLVTPSEVAGKFYFISPTHSSIPLPASKQPSVVLTPFEDARKGNNVSSTHASVPLPASKQPSAVLTPSEEAQKFNSISSKLASVPLPVSKQSSLLLAEEFLSETRYDAPSLPSKLQKSSSNRVQTNSNSLERWSTSSKTQGCSQIEELNNPRQEVKDDGNVLNSNSNIITPSSTRNKFDCHVRPTSLKKDFNKSKSSFSPLPTIKSNTDIEDQEARGVRSGSTPVFPRVTTPSSCEPPTALQDTNSNSSSKSSIELLKSLSGYLKEIIEGFESNNKEILQTGSAEQDLSKETNARLLSIINEENGCNTEEEAFVQSEDCSQIPSEPEHDSDTSATQNKKSKAKIAKSAVTFQIMNNANSSGSNAAGRPRIAGRMGASERIRKTPATFPKSNADLRRIQSARSEPYFTSRNCTLLESNAKSKYISQPQMAKPRLLSTKPSHSPQRDSYNIPTTPLKTQNVQRNNSRSLKSRADLDALVSRLYKNTSSRPADLVESKKQNANKSSPSHRSLYSKSIASLKKTDSAQSSTTGELRSKSSSKALESRSLQKCQNISLKPFISAVRSGVPPVTPLKRTRSSQRKSVILAQYVIATQQPYYQDNSPTRIAAKSKTKDEPRKPPAASALSALQKSHGDHVADDINKFKSSSDATGLARVESRKKTFSSCSNLRLHPEEPSKDNARSRASKFRQSQAHLSGPIVYTYKSETFSTVKNMQKPYRNYTRSSDRIKKDGRNAEEIALERTNNTQQYISRRPQLSIKLPTQLQDRSSQCVVSHEVYCLKPEKETTKLETANLKPTECSNDTTSLIEPNRNTFGDYPHTFVEEEKSQRDSKVGDDMELGPKEFNAGSSQEFKETESPKQLGNEEIPLSPLTTDGPSQSFEGKEEPSELGVDKRSARSLAAAGPTPTQECKETEKSIRLGNDERSVAGAGTSQELEETERPKRVGNDKKRLRPLVAARPYLQECKETEKPNRLGNNKRRLRPLTAASPSQGCEQTKKPRLGYNERRLRPLAATGLSQKLKETDKYNRLETTKRPVGRLEAADPSQKYEETEKYNSLGNDKRRLKPLKAQDFKETENSNPLGNYEGKLMPTAGVGSSQNSEETDKSNDVKNDERPIKPLVDAGPLKETDKSNRLRNDERRLSPAARASLSQDFEETKDSNRLENDDKLVSPPTATSSLVPPNKQEPHMDQVSNSIRNTGLHRPQTAAARPGRVLQKRPVTSLRSALRVRKSEQGSPSVTSRSVSIVLNRFGRNRSHSRGSHSGPEEGEAGIGVNDKNSVHVSIQTLFVEGKDDKECQFEEISLEEPQRVETKVLFQTPDPSRSQIDEPCLKDCCEYCCGGRKAYPRCREILSDSKSCHEPPALLDERKISSISDNRSSFATYPADDSASRCSQSGANRSSYRRSRPDKGSQTWQKSRTSDKCSQISRGNSQSVRILSVRDKECQHDAPNVCMEEVAQDVIDEYGAIGCKVISNSVRAQRGGAYNLAEILDMAGTPKVCPYCKMGFLGDGPMPKKGQIIRTAVGEDCDHTCRGTRIIPGKHNTLKIEPCCSTSSVSKKKQGCCSCMKKKKK